jgi:glycosyltransferase involved in cell wall biosynthesis
MSVSDAARDRSPFLDVADARCRSIGWALVTAPITTGRHHRQLAQLSRDGYRFAGMPGYLSFPQGNEADVRDYSQLCEAWCHCFREPDRFLPSDQPRALISHSDFTDPQRVSPQRFRRQPCGELKYDFLYVGAVAAWKQEAKGWPAAGPWIQRICDDLELRALVVGAPAQRRRPSARVHFTTELEWQELLGRIAAARFVFVPNVNDASPRTVAEALCLNVPVVVNRSILGGWKYVNAFTGSFFDDENDVVQAVRRCLERPRGPRRWFQANYGPYIAGRRLLRLLLGLDSRITERSHLTVTDLLPTVPMQQR